MAGCDGKGKGKGKGKGRVAAGVALRRDAA